MFISAFCLTRIIYICYNFIVVFAREVEYVKTLLKYLKPFYVKMTLGFGIKTLGTVIELFIPYILSHILANVKSFSMNEIT